MWSDPQNDLNDFVKLSNTLQIESLVIAEWNMNSFATINNYGSYRFRPGVLQGPNSQYNKVPSQYIESDPGDYFTDANKSIYVFNDFVDKNDEPVIFEADEVRRSLYYDLKQCFEPFRPRSGINKPLYLNTYIDNVRSAKKPRYYMASRYDNFKYWNSYRTQLNDTRGRAKYTVTNRQLSGGVGTLTIGSHELKVGDSIDVYSITDSRGPLRYIVTNKQLSTGTATLNIGTHQINVGDSINVSEVDSELNGTFIVSAKTSNSISYSVSSPSTITSASAFGVLELNVGINDSLNGTFIVSSKTNDTISYSVDSSNNIPSSSANGRVYLDVNITEYGVSVDTNPTGFNNSIGYQIDDTCPFVVYNEQFATNRIVVKMQTNMSDVDDEEVFIDRSGIEATNPYTDINLSSIPKRWSIQYLVADGVKESNWINAISFNENSTRSDGTPIVPWDGHVEISYGIKYPGEFRDSFKLMNSFSASTQLPPSGMNGDAYIIGETLNNPGTLYIWRNFNNDWMKVPVEYGFSLVETDDTKNIGIINTLSNPEYIIDNVGTVTYKELVFIKGLRIVVETMYAPGKSFDLIELSPRIRANISKYVESYSVSKNIANDSTGIPVGGLIASSGTIEIMNFDGSFTEKNIITGQNGASLNKINTTKLPVVGSIVAQYLKTNVKFDIYEAILNVNGYDKYIPIKTMYAEEFPVFAGGMSSISITLRDFFFRFETIRAIPMFFTEITLTAAVAMLLDNIGFSNYVFVGFDERESIKVENQEFYASIQDPVIPYFFVHPDVNIAQALIDLATSFQAAMFFDEYNNFVMMPKEYMIPDINQRSSSLTLYGQATIENSNIVLPNIIEISGADKKILNDGTIQYTTRYIQKEVSSLQQSRYIDDDKIFNYKPVLLWEVGANEATKTTNQANQSTSGMSLTAVPLNNSLSINIPEVENRQIINNTIDVGENAVWIGRFQGYLYANGEIIRYDAVEYNIPINSINGNTVSNTVWISSNQEYQKYFASMKFGGKIFPTGLLRIYVEPFYEEIDIIKNRKVEKQTVYKDGIVKMHGRGQFGTQIVEHPAGLPDYWSNDKNVRCCKMDSSYLFTTTPTENISYPAFSTISTPDFTILPASSAGAGVETALAIGSTRNGIIKNFMRAVLPSDDTVRKRKTVQSATIQSSALVFAGAQEKNTAASGSAVLTTKYPANSNKRDYIFYVYKELNNQFKHFGTRVRILGKTKVGESFQVPRGSFEYFNVKAESSNEKVSIEGGSAGIAFNINPDTNIGYYFEITSMTAENLQQYQKRNEATGKDVSVLHNVNFYKVLQKKNTTQAIPKKIWGGLAQILVDEGIFVGMDKIGTSNPTVYDLSVEYENVGNKRVFYLYINGSLLNIVEDASPLPEYNNMALFVRGSTEAMFENVYALQSLLSKNIGETVVNEVSDAFGIGEISSISALRKYGLSGFIQASYLSNISAGVENKIKIYFEEFGTILRECMYFNIRYDKAYPALISEIAPTASKDRGYTVSGFQSGSYGAEFMIFNNADKTIVLDESTGNYLRILGVTFTQDTSQELTVDSYFKELSNFSDPLIVDSTIYSPVVAEKIYDTIKTSRQRNGKRDFTINPIYLQNEDMANDLMEWMANKTLRERKSFSINVFGTPHLQLGDIININYDLPEGVKIVDETKQFVVASIETQRSQDDFSMSLRVVEI